MIQAVYMWQLESMDELAVVSMCFSTISIIVVVAGIFTQKFMVDSSGYAVIRFDVTSPCLTSKAYVLRRQVHGIRDQIASSLGISNPKLVEILRPQIVPQGLRLVIHIHLHDIQFRDTNYQALLEHMQVHI